MASAPCRPAAGRALLARHVAGAGRRGAHRTLHAAQRAGCLGELARHARRARRHARERRGRARRALRARYGTNGIRNGMATSLFVLGVSYLEKNKMLMCFFLVLAISFHQTIALPLLAFIVRY